MKEANFTAQTDKELLAAVAMWLAMELQRNKDAEPQPEPTGGDDGGPG